NHLAHLVLEALQGGELAFVHHDIVADQPDLRAALDLAFRDAAAGHLAHLGDGEHFEDFGVAEEVLAYRRRKQAGHGLAHLVDEVIDDGVIADLDAVALGDLTGLRVGAHVEAEHHRTRCRGERHVGLGDAADASMNDAGSDLASTELPKRCGYGLDRALHVAFDDERELLDAGLFQLAHHLLEAAASARHCEPLAALAGAIIGDLSRACFVLDYGEVIACLRRRVEAEHFDGNRGTSFFHVVADIVDQRAHPSPGLACDDKVAEPERAALDESGANRPASTLELRLCDHAFGGAIGIGGQLQ